MVKDHTFALFNFGTVLLDLAIIFGGGRDLDSGNSLSRKLSRELDLDLGGIRSW